VHSYYSKQLMLYIITILLGINQRSSQSNIKELIIIAFTTLFICYHSVLALKDIYKVIYIWLACMVKGAEEDLTKRHADRELLDIV
jgi:hypothetical protein